MAAPRFILSDPKAKKKTTIYFVYRMGSKDRIKYHTGEKIHPDHWDFDLQRPDLSIEDRTLKPELQSIHAQLERYKDLITDIQYEWKKKKAEKSLDHLRNELEKEFKRKPQIREPMEFFKWIDHFIEKPRLTMTKKSKRPISKLTITKEITTRNFLKKFADEERKGKLKFSDIDLEFYSDFVLWLQTKHNMGENTIGKYIKTLKTFLAAAKLDKTIKIKLSEDVINNLLPTPSDDSHHIFLDESELQKLYQIDLSSKKMKRLDKVRDIFLIACYTALRYSDFGSLIPENFIETRTILKVKTHKTGKDVFIPAHPIVVDIMEKWEWNLPRPMTNQVMNRYIKELCALAGINSKITFTRIKGGKEERLTKKKWEMISTHTARRTAATNWYLADMKTIDIMKITGHKSEVVFLNYIKLTDQQHAQKMLNNPYFQRKPKITLRITRDDDSFVAMGKVGNHTIAAEAETLEKLKTIATKAVNRTFSDRGIVYTTNEITFHDGFTC
jgi:site-specific recombinase XerD